MKVFEFADYEEFIRFGVSERLYGHEGRKKSNLMRVSKDLGYASASLLSMVMSGKRIPSEEMCESLIRNWKLSLKEAEFFTTQVFIERKTRNGEDASNLRDRAQSLKGHKTNHVFSKAVLNRIKEWHYIVIQQIVELPKFKEDPVWISLATRGKISSLQAMDAIRDLEKIGILDRDSSGRLRNSATFSESSLDVPSSAIRAHQKGMIKQALDALDDQPVHARFFNTLTITFDSKQLPEVRKQLLEMMRNINSEFSSTQPDSVYQLCLQFFEHTNTAKNVN